MNFYNYLEKKILMFESSNKIYYFLNKKGIIYPIINNLFLDVDLKNNRILIKKINLTKVTELPEVDGKLVYNILKNKNISAYVPKEESKNYYETNTSKKADYIFDNTKKVYYPIIKGNSYPIIENDKIKILDFNKEDYVIDNDSINLIYSYKTKPSSSSSGNVEKDLEGLEETEEPAAEEPTPETPEETPPT